MSHSHFPHHHGHQCDHSRGGGHHMHHHDVAHHHGEEEDGGHQCDHSKGFGGHEGEHFSNEVIDGLGQKEFFTLDDWVTLYGAFPGDTSKGKVSEWLVKYVSQILTKEPARILVPLCGKTPDMHWLYDRGNTVVGIEGVERPVKEFFMAYSDLDYSVEPLSWGGCVYKTKDERLKIYVCDILKIPQGVLGPFDAGIDYGGYSAIDPSTRSSYVSVIQQMLEKDFTYFLEFCHDLEPPDTRGKPHSVSFITLRKEWGTFGKLTVLQTVDVSEAWKCDSFFNTFVLVTPKQ